MILSRLMPVLIALSVPYCKIFTECSLPYLHCCQVMYKFFVTWNHFAYYGVNNWAGEVLVIDLAGRCGHVCQTLRGENVRGMNPNFVSEIIDGLLVYEGCHLKCNLSTCQPWWTLWPQWSRWSNPSWSTSRKLCASGERQTWWANMLVPLSILTTTSLCMTLGVLHLVCLRWAQGVTLRTRLAVGFYVIMISGPIVTLCFTALVVTGGVSWIQFTSWPDWAPFVCPSEASSCPYHCSNARQYLLPEPVIYFVF